MHCLPHMIRIIFFQKQLSTIKGLLPAAQRSATHRTVRRSFCYILNCLHKVKHCPFLPRPILEVLQSHLHSKYTSVHEQNQSPNKHVSKILKRQAKLGPVKRNI